LVLRRYSTNACQSCAIKHSCTTGKERRISRWEHEHILEAVQRRLDEHPEKMRQRRGTVGRSGEAHRAASEALLVGRPYNDRGNRMSPGFSAINGVRSRHRVKCFASVIGMKPISHSNAL
jgi:hypothetical protein